MSPVKILVVDDEPDLELLVRQKFRRQIRGGEFEFSFAHNGAEALERLQAEPQTEMVLTDINMPVMDGLALLGKISERDATIKTVVVSAYSDMENIRTAMNRGAYDFLIKPINFEDLTATIDKTARHARMLKQALKEREQLMAIQQELNVATRIQQAILPCEFPPFPGVKEFDLYAAMIPAREVGGDFYDFFLLDQDRLGIVIGDVSDKGVPAAIFMAVTRTLLKSIAVAGVGPSECLERVNRLLVAENTSCMFVTLCYGILNIRSGEFEYCNAGHNPPILVAPQGAATQLEAPGGVAVGVTDEIPYRTGTVRIRPGETLFLYTDGITEAADGDHQMFSVERLQACLQQAGDASPRQFINAVVYEVREFAGDAPQSDDLTMLVLKYSS
jgi:sigma-B regulation protein RsbU (phosphoserine phosphatase)